MSSAKQPKDSMVLGVVLIVLGVLVLTGPLKVPFVGLITGVLLILAGVLIVLGKLEGHIVLAIVLLLLGVLLVVPNAVGKELTGVLDTVVNLVVGVGLLVYGILKVSGKK